ncbi:glycosyltransferase family 2 protein [Gracilibacillus marinus]|uniref:Glycosyltransferase family 2 protein n=1 Tax=Gracilibacillus marinus TaxID=630535 RepID=A0ABV8VSM5_9BACI
MKKPLVTIFIPVFNSEQYLKESINSILNQTYNNIELLLVDDGSTDNSVKLIQSIDDPRIRLLQNKGNKGIPYTRNVGLREARGKYMAIMDSDDIAMPTRIETQVNYLENNPDIDAIGSYYIKFTDNNERKISVRYTKADEIKMMLLYFTPISNPSSMVRISTVKENNLSYNEDFFVSQDYEFWAQLSKVGKIEVVEDYLLKYRTGHENITKVSKQEKLEKRNKLISRIHEDLLNYYGINLTEEEKFIYNQIFSQNPKSIQNIDNIPVVINKLKEWANSNSIFNKDKFMIILDENLRIGISNQSFGTREKLRIYRETITNKKVKDIFFIVVKDFYYKVKQ